MQCRGRLRQRLHPRLHLADRRRPAVDQHQRFAVAVDLVIELDAVHVGVAAARWFHLRFPSRGRRFKRSWNPAAQPNAEPTIFSVV
jgi:hypothetical protein